MPSARSGRLLLIIADRDTADRFAHALAQTGDYGFVVADEEHALTVARAAQPDLAVVALPSDRGVAICQAFRDDVTLAESRLLLVIERQHLGKARIIGANGYVLQPASALLVAAEACAVLARPERRQLLPIDRRIFPRGGRRLTDIQSD